jgi:cell division protein FtsI/penicillin-binding protein 2
LSVTPIQLVSAYAAIANGGMLMKPYVVDEIIRPDGSIIKTKPQSMGRAISLRTSRLITGMLVSVVELGHGKHAGVPGYYVAGKTGTAQVPDPRNGGYQKDVSIGSFAGYAPADNPRFVMLVKIDHPRDVQWAESSAAPLFGDIASFLLSYLQVPTERDVKAIALPPLPVVTSTTP